MTATAVLAKRLLLPAGEVGGLCEQLGLRLPPGFEAPSRPVCRGELLVDGAVRPSVAAGLAATCAPRIGVLITSTVGDVAAAFGIRTDLGGSMLRAAGSEVELGVWPPHRMGAELARAVPALGRSPLPAKHLPLHDLPDDADLQGSVVGTLRATVVSPPAVLGQLVWLATSQGWLSLEPAEVRDGQRWARVQPVEPVDLAAAVAPWVATGLA